MKNAVQPLYSIIVPTYQEEKLIEKTLALFDAESLQRYNAELVVSDGGSTDGTLSIVRNYTSSVVCHNESRRQTIAEGRNKGAEIAQGSIFIFINGDTVIADKEDFFAAVEASFARKKTVALFCPVRIFPEEERTSDVLFHSFYNKYIKLLNAIGIGMGRGECQIVRREAFERVKGYNSAIAAGEDFDLYRRLSKVGAIATDPRLTVYESPRRFRKYGYLRILWRWNLNALSVMFFRRSANEEWEAIR